MAEPKQPGLNVVAAADGVGTKDEPLVRYEVDWTAEEERRAQRK